MFEILDAVLERAQARGAADVEVFGERSTSHRIKVYRQEVEQLTAAQRRGVGVRVFSGGAVGHDPHRHAQLVHAHRPRDVPAPRPHPGRA